MIDEIPADVREYLLAGDGLGKVTVIEKFPGVEARLRTPAVQQALYHYLAGEEPWIDPVPVLAMAALDSLLAEPTAEGAKAIHKLTGHPNSGVRVRTYRYLFAMVYPQRDYDGMIRVIEDMLNDEDEMVRVEGAQMVKNMKLAGQMHGFLQNWKRLAPERGWNSGKSYGIVDDLVR